MDSRSGKPQTQRQLQVAEQVRHVLAWVFERDQLRDPAIRGFKITVAEVRVSPDFRNATVFIVPFGGVVCNIFDVLKGFNRAAPFLQKQIAQSINLRRTPRLSFVADKSFDGAPQIDELLRKPSVARDLLKKEGAKKRLVVESKIEL